MGRKKTDADTSPELVPAVAAQAGKAEGAADPTASAEAPPAAAAAEPTPDDVTYATIHRAAPAVAAFLAAEAVANNLGGVPFLRESDLVEAAMAAAELYQFLARHFARGRVYHGEIVWAEARSLGYTDGTAWHVLHPARRTAAETFAYVAHLSWQDERVALAKAERVPTRLAAVARDETMLETVDRAGDLTDEGRALQR